MRFGGVINVGYSFFIIIVSALIGNVVNTFKLPLTKEVSKSVQNLPSVSFTFTNNNTCSGSTILFNATASGVGNLTYSWNFGDGSTSTEQNPMHLYDMLGCGSDANYTVSLTVTDSNGSTTVNEVVTVKQKPFMDVVDLNPGITGPFENCNIGDAAYVLTLGLAPNSDTCFTSFTIDWGDGTIDENVSFPRSHSYTNVGYFDLVVTGIGINGCVTTATRVVSNSSNPKGGLVTPGATDLLCLPTSPLGFAISNWGTNPPETVYTVDYGDGTIITLNQMQMEASIYYNPTNPPASTNFPIPHTYTTTNCPDPDYYVSLSIITSCRTTNLTAGPISVYQKPEVSYVIPTTGCVNTPVPITNTSFFGYTLDCDTTVAWSWDMGDGTTYTDFEPVHSYTAPGTYTISLYAHNHCGTTETITQQICIEPPFTPEFSLVNNEGCMPYSTVLRNTTTVVDSCSEVVYEWIIDYTSDFCGTTNGANFINGTDASSETAEIEFTSPGRYEITLQGTNACGAISSSSQEVLVKAPPEVAIEPIDYICGVGTTIAPIATVNSCSTEAVTYNWSLDVGVSPTDWEFINGTNSNSEFPEIRFHTVSDYTLSLEITNACGTTIDTEDILFSDVPTISNTATSQELCSGIPIEEIIFSSNDSGTNYIWTGTSPTNNVTGVIASGTTNSIPAHSLTLNSGTSGTVIYTVTPYLVEECPGEPVEFTITINQSPIITTQPLAAEYCIGDTILDLEVVVENGVGIPNYQWYANTTNDTDAPTPVGTNASTLTVPNVDLGVYYYYCVITFSEGGCGSIMTDIVEIAINQTPEISDYATTICSGNSFSIIPEDSSVDVVPSNVTYTWPTPIVNPTGAIQGAIEQLTPTTSLSQLLNNTTSNSATVTYTITPNSANCVGDAFEVVVTVNPSIAVDTIVTNNTCFGLADGSIEVTISGGIPFSESLPYSIIWTGPNGFTSTDKDIFNLEAGDYYLEVTDDGNCIYEEAITITEPEELAFETILFDSDTISCFGANNGAIGIDVVGGILPYVYTWTKDGELFSSEEDLLDLGPGVYEVTVTDANNCGPLTQSFVLEEPSNMQVTLNTQTNVPCFGEATGALVIDVIGGRPGYTFEWTGPDGFVSNEQNIENLIAGTYTVVVVDSSGCEASLDFEITQTDEITLDVTLTQLACYNDNNGSITIQNITGGVGPYTVAWSNFGTGMVQTDLSPGFYTITITDSLNCSKAFTYEIEEVPIFLIEPEVVQITCRGASDGRIVLNFQGGEPPVSVVWNDDATAGVERNNLGPGTYTVTITDGTPCVIQESFTIVEASELELLAEVTDALECVNANSGAIQLSISGGSSPYHVEWSNGATTKDLQNISPNTYHVIVTDANGCRIEESWEVRRPRPLTIELQDQSSIDCEAQSIVRVFTAITTGGVPPYQLTWSSGSVSGASNEIMTTTTSGLVTLEVIDSRGCRTTHSVDVEIPVLGDANFEATSFGYVNYGIFAMLDPIQFIHTTTGDYESVSWDFGDGNFSTEENPIHTYQREGIYEVILTAHYAFGCQYTYSMNLEVVKGYNLIMPNAFTPNDDGVNDFFGPEYIGLKNLELYIYDTWGSLIYSETGDVIRGWNGKIKGEPAENGNYHYVFRAHTIFEEPIQKKGAFTFIK